MRKRFKFRVFALIAAFLILLCGAASAVSADGEISEEPETETVESVGVGSGGERFLNCEKYFNGEKVVYTSNDFYSDMYKLHNQGYTNAEALDILKRKFIDNSRFNEFKEFLKQWGQAVDDTLTGIADSVRDLYDSIFSPGEYDSDSGVYSDIVYAWDIYELRVHLMFVNERNRSFGATFILYSIAPDGTRTVLRNMYPGSNGRILFLSWLDASVLPWDQIQIRVNNGYAEIYGSFYDGGSSEFGLTRDFTYSNYQKYLGWLSWDISSYINNQPGIYNNTVYDDDGNSYNYYYDYNTNTRYIVDQSGNKYYYDTTNGYYYSLDSDLSLANAIYITDGDDLDTTNVSIDYITNYLQQELDLQPVIDAINNLSSKLGNDNSNNYNGALSSIYNRLGVINDTLSSIIGGQTSILNAINNINRQLTVMSEDEKQSQSLEFARLQAEFLGKLGYTSAAKNMNNLGYAMFGKRIFTIDEESGTVTAAIVTQGTISSNTEMPHLYINTPTFSTFGIETQQQQLDLFSLLSYFDGYMYIIKGIISFLLSAAFTIAVIRSIPGIISSAAGVQAEAWGADMYSEINDVNSDMRLSSSQRARSISSIRNRWSHKL